MKSILVMTFILTAALSTAGQTATPPPTQCTVKVAPVIRGVKLGMTMKDVLAMFPGSRENEMVKNSLTAGESYGSFGVSGFLVFPGQYPTKERFAGISSISFTFIDERLVRYGVAYDRPPWSHTDDFINKIAGAFNLPTAENWAVGQSFKTLSCDGFTMHASANSTGLISVMTNDDPNRIQTARKAASEEKQRQEFKP